MATGDITDFVRRLRAALPARWFPDDAPVLNGILSGFAASWAYLYSLLTYVILQARVATATGVFLDMVALDFFQGRITRNASEPDTHFRLRILTEILRPRATRASVDRALFDLTGVHPTIFEPADTTDTGGYNIGGVGYNVAGGWGSLELPFQAFITAYRPVGGGIANVSGYGNSTVGIGLTGGLGGYGQGAIEWASQEMIAGAISDADIYATVSAAMPAATIGWTRGLNAAAPIQTPQTLRPVSAFSRSTSAARAVATVSSGVLLRGLGAGSTRGRLIFSTIIAAVSARGLGIDKGRSVALVTSLNSLGMISRGVGSAFGRAVRLSGAGLLHGQGVGMAKGVARLSGSQPVTARGFAASFGNQLYGAVVILGGRGKTTLRGAATVAVTAALRGAGLAKSVGRAADLTVVLPVANLSGLGVARSLGRAVRISGVGMLHVVAPSQGKGKAAIAGTTPLSGRGAAKTFGRQIYGAVIILGGRGTATGDGALSGPTQAAGLVALGQARGRGKAASIAAGSVALQVTSNARAAGRMGVPAKAAALRGRARGLAQGRGVMTLQQAAPTAPTNLVASNATTKSIVLTWSPSIGAGGSNDGSLVNDGGVVILSGGLYGYPTTSAVLAAGALWSNGGVVTIVPGVTPNPAAGPVYLNSITAVELRTLGGGNLPRTSPPIGSGQIWNSGGEAWVA